MNRTRRVAMVAACAAFGLGTWQMVSAQAPAPADRPPPPADRAPPPPADRPPPPPPGMPAPPPPPGGYKRIEGPVTLNPGDWPLHFPYPDIYDAPVAAPEPHWVLYEDAKVRLVEVGYFPGIHGKMHGHPYPSVFANDSPGPKIDYNVNLDENRPPRFAFARPLKSAQYPNCMSLGPQSPHAETNLDTYPRHFLRLEYRRVDGKDIVDKWREWYPEATRPGLVAAHARDTDDGTIASPANYRLLLEDDHVRLVEVLLRPGETEHRHSDLYPAVLAMDTADAGLTVESKGAPVETSIGGSPVGSASMSCAITAPRKLYALHNPGTVPIHYYRIEYKRVDGEGIKTNWRQWYPRMAKLADEYAKYTPLLNY